MSSLSFSECVQTCNEKLANKNARVDLNNISGKAFKKREKNKNIL